MIFYMLQSKKINFMFTLKAAKLNDLYRFIEQYTRFIITGVILRSENSLVHCSHQQVSITLCECGLFLI